MCADAIVLGFFKKNLFIHKRQIHKAKCFTQFRLYDP